MTKILIVHDTPARLRAIRGAALRAGYTSDEIVEATDEESAYDAIAKHQFGVAVIDISLTPKQDTHEGLDVIKELRDRQLQCRIVGLTSRFHELGAEVLDQGGDDFIFTEWDTIDYLALLEQKLAMWRAARPRRISLVV
jgi:DNA-binding response OmpR family regulator